VLLCFYAYFRATAGAKMHEDTCFHAVPKETHSREFIWFQQECGGKAHLSEEGEALSEMACRERVLSANGSVPLGLPEPRRASNWFAVYTSPRHEKRVEQHLRLRDVESFLPVYRAPRQWRNGLKVVLDLPLFPGYIFVRIERPERVRVLEVPGVLAIVSGAAGEMARLPEAEVEALRSGLHLRQAEPHPLLTVGRRARIRAGALAGLEGVVVRKKNSFRVVLTMDLILQSIAVEVDGAELEPVDI
jgi:transcription antitermination factor NusG